jgi:hypothetical protein
VRRIALAIALAAAVLLVTGPALAQSDTGWTIERFDVHLDVRGDGSVLVTERIDVDFGDLSRRGIFRVIPVHYRVSGADSAHIPDGLTAGEVRRVIAIDRVAVTSSAPDDVERSTEGGHLTIRIGDPDVYVTGAQSYVLSYRVRGALNAFDAVDELYWNATGNDWSVPIRAASVEVSAPDIREAACFAGRLGGTRACASGDVGGQRARFSVTDLQPGEGVTVAVGMPAGAVDVPAPMIEALWHPLRALAGSAWAWPLAILTAVLGFGGVALLVYRQGRDRVLRGGVSVDGRLEAPEAMRRGLFSRLEAPVRFRPPDDLRPAQLGLLVDERVDAVEISATIVDLAVRGYLRIEEYEKGRWLLSRTDWRLVRLPEPDDDTLLPFERKLLDALFSSGETIEVGELKGKFHEEHAEVCKLVYADGVRRGWFRRSPQATRGLWAGTGVLALLVAVGLFVAAMAFTTIALAAVPLVLAALALLVAHGAMPHRTAKGSARLAETLGFREFIRTAEADRMAFAEQEQIFARYLPYAMVFGAVDRWVGAFAGLSTAAATAAGATAWYASSTGATSLDGLARGLSDFSHTVGPALSTAPSSSGSGGGGSSGGGFGGGGGGSW